MEFFLKHPVLHIKKVKVFQNFGEIYKFEIFLPLQLDWLPVGEIVSNVVKIKMEIYQNMAQTTDAVISHYFFYFVDTLFRTP